VLACAWASSARAFRCGAGVSRPKFVVRYSCDHVERGASLAVLELGIHTAPLRVELRRSCDRVECAAVLVGALTAALRPVSAPAVVVVAPGRVARWRAAVRRLFARSR
jgi:hypothetical protein